MIYQQIRIIEQVRSDIAKKFGIAWYKNYFLLLRHRKKLWTESKLGWISKHVL